MCFEIAFNETGKGAAISVTVDRFRASAATIARRVGSAIAKKTRSSVSLFSTTWLNIRAVVLDCQRSKCKIAPPESLCQTGTWNDE